MSFEAFQAYLQELRSLPPEVQLEPELKPQRVQLDKRIRSVQHVRRLAWACAPLTSK
jgi:hypothetical protein